MLVGRRFSTQAKTRVCLATLSLPSDLVAADRFYLCCCLRSLIGPVPSVSRPAPFCCNAAPRRYRREQAVDVARSALGHGHCGRTGGRHRSEHCGIIGHAAAGEHGLPSQDRRRRGPRGHVAVLPPRCVAMGFELCQVLASLAVAVPGVAGVPCVAVPGVTAAIARRSPVCEPARA